MALHMVHMEDERTLREAIEIALFELQPDANLMQFDNSDDAVAYIEAHYADIDLYLLDIRVPGRMDGLQVAQRIAQLNAPGQIVFTSAFDAPKREVLNALKAQYLVKPYNLEPTAKRLLEWAQRARA